MLNNCWFVLGGILIGIICPFLRANPESDHNSNHLIRSLLRRRQATLKQIALTVLKEEHRFYPPNCPKDRLIITEYAFGRSGNNIIEFSHGLWLGRKLNATLVVPDWIQGIFKPFDTTVLQSLYCYTFDSVIPKQAKTYEITSENSFFPFQLKKEFAFPKLLPVELINFHFSEDWTASTFPSSALPSSSSSLIRELSRHFLQVYAAFWCCPDKRIVLIAEVMIEYYLKNSLGYSAVHKRQLEGGCAKVLSQTTSPVDFPAKEIPLYHVDWFHHPLHKWHPICEMTPSFLEETLFLNHRQRNLSNLFIAFDGRGEIQPYEQRGAVHLQLFYDYLTSTPSTSPSMNISSHLRQKLLTSIDSKYFKDMMKFIDMYLAIHSEFFILNPRSSFSFQIYVIRVCLGLQSVPVMRLNDLYMQKVPEELMKANRSLWVNWMSILHAATEIV